MLRPVLAIVAALALAVPLAFTFVAAEDRPTPAASDATALPLTYTELHLGSDLLPGPTGWFAVPITVDREAYVRVDVSYYEFEHGQFAMSQAIVAIEGAAADPSWAFGGYHQDPAFAIEHDGQELVRCCEDLVTAWSTGMGSGGQPILVEPGQTLWVGLAAFQWDDQHNAWFTISGQAVLTQGEPRTGARVEAVDLFEEARRAGTHAYALSQHVQPAFGAASRTWTSDGYGLFSLTADAWVDSGSDARIRLSIPGEAPREARIQGDSGAYAGAHRAGTYAVTLDDVHAPLLQQGPAIHAVALFADVDVPGDVAFVYP
ncbi:MAG TPA: hypothetical protein VM370_10370 [Candidatus Thermoplasmatota archaeon]|nr:hypothetical protein [Candidatus Thermoplasmatota archaeon]